MKWNWQQKDWPQFSWDESTLTRAEVRFAEGTGFAAGVSKHLDPDLYDAMMIELMSREAADTSAIEGETLDRDSVQSSIRRHLGLGGDFRGSTPAEAGIAQMMVDLFGRVTEPLDDVTLHHWHRYITNGRIDLKDIGRYRTHDDPMQIVSGPVHDPWVHFEAPPSNRVALEMDAFWNWLSHSAPRGTHSLPPLTRAGIAHIWFQSIHPFEDGNGRIGRAISEKIIAQGFTSPVITGMAGTLLRHRKGYYAALERAHCNLQITEWLQWFAAKAIEAQNYTSAQVQFVLQKSRLIQRLRGQINARQDKALMRLFAAGPEGFVGGLSAANYMRITGAPPATATRDLASLVSVGALLRTGENKATHYSLNIDIQRPRQIEPSDLASI